MRSELNISGGKFATSQPFDIASDLHIGDILLKYPLMGNVRDPDLREISGKRIERNANIVHITIFVDQFEIVVDAFDLPSGEFAGIINRIFDFSGIPGVVHIIEIYQMFPAPARNRELIW